MKLTVIIPTFNRSELLKNTLQSICLQSFPQNDFEVLVIDNGSIDNTKETIESFTPVIKNLRYFYELTPGLHLGRHIGLNEAKADILVYADDDIEALSTWLEGIWESFQINDVALVGGNSIPKYEIPPPMWVESLWSYNEFGKHNGYYSLIDFGNTIKEINPYFVFGCNFSIKKEALIEFGGFHPDGMPREKIVFRGDGESYISQMIIEKGLKTIFNPKASVFHFVPKTRMAKEYMYHRGFIQGISNSYTQYRNSIAKQQLNHKQNRRIIHPIFAKIINRIMLRNIKSDIKTIKSKLDDTENEYLNAFNSGLSDGYIYHQNELKINNELQKWVLKSNYL